MSRLQLPEYFIIGMVILAIVSVITSMPKTPKKVEKPDATVLEELCAKYRKQGTAKNYSFCHEYFDGYKNIKK